MKMVVALQRQGVLNAEEEDGDWRKESEGLSRDEMSMGIDSLEWGV